MAIPKTRTAAVCAIVLAGVAGLYAAFQAPAQNAAKPKTAAEQFKNIQVLKNIPADQLIPTMQFISASLNVECTFCHVEHAFDKDDKKPKQIARKMMQMQMAIDANHFEGHQAVTCDTCHRGSPHPQSIPAIAEENAPPPIPEHPEEGETASLPSAQQVVEKYVAAVGGKSAIGKLTSLVETGNMTGFGGHEMPIEIYTKAPSDRISIAKTPMGENITAVNQQSGWMAMGNRPGREMSNADANGYRLEAQFALIPNLDNLFEKFRVVEAEKIGDHDTLLVAGMRQGEPPIRMNFDQQSGLLVRLTRYTQTALGLNPVQIDFADYRQLDGVKIPYRWTLARPNGRFTIQVSEAKANVPIEGSRFQRPPAPSGGRSGTGRH